MQSTTLPVPLRTVDPSCPYRCDADHHGERHGERVHSVALATIPVDVDGTLCVDFSVRDGERPEVVLHDQDGNEIRFPEYVAAAVSRAVAAAGGVSWAVAS